MLKSIITALILSVFNLVSAFIIARYALKKEGPSFNKIIFGSMVVRYFIVMILVFICLKYMDLDKLAFGLTFLISTFILILAEIFYLNSRANLLNLQFHRKK